MEKSHFIMPGALLAGNPVSICFPGWRRELTLCYGHANPYSADELVRPATFAETLLTERITKDIPGWNGLAARALHLFWFKCFGTAGFTALFFAAYLYLLKHPAYPVLTVPSTAADRLVAFEPSVLPLYLSLWIYVSIPPMLMDSRGEIARYGIWIGLMCLAGLSIFYFWPNAVPPLHLDWSRDPGIAFLKHADAAGNACPSMHVATAVFSALWLHFRMPLLGLRHWSRGMNLLWGTGIVYSTMATKQHMAVDVLAGALLAATFFWIGHRLQPPGRHPHPPA